MRLWSVHPRSLDRVGLVACWREGLLARKVLLGATRGYRAHPQLTRFRTHSEPVSAIDAYLHAIQQEATARGYRFDLSKLGPLVEVEPIALTTGQLRYEVEHLRQKVSRREPAWLERVVSAPHPLFSLEEGPIATWERPAP